MEEKIFSTGYIVALILLFLGLVFSPLSNLGIWWLMLIPISAALYTAAKYYRTDKLLSYSALVSVLGLGLILLLKSFLSKLAA